jgi:hypothetical protein
MEAARLSRRSPDGRQGSQIVFPHAREFHKPTLAVESETLTSLGSRGHTALHLTILEWKCQRGSSTQSMAHVGSGKQHPP